MVSRAAIYALVGKQTSGSERLCAVTHTPSQTATASRSTARASKDAHYHPEFAMMLHRKKASNMSKQPGNYENNPFYIGYNGLIAFFKQAQPVAIYASVLAGLAFILNSISTLYDMLSSATMTEAEMNAQYEAIGADIGQFLATDVSSLLIGGILFASGVFLFIVASLWLYGILEYTGARLAQHKQTTLKQAAVDVTNSFTGYLWVYIIMFVKIFLWSLLFIVPGVIMAVRYSLAGTAYFAENRRGNAAIQRSLELTKDAWFTTFGATGLWNLMTFGLITYVLQPGINGVLFRQFAEVTDHKISKPAPHWLSILALVVPLVLFAIFFGFIFLILLVLAVSGGSFS